jgi:hypothetical protein
MATVHIKELGYRGYRPELLNGVVSAYRYLERLDYRIVDNNGPVRNELTDYKRHFVGQVQKLLDPTKRRTYFDRLRSDVAQTRQPAEK